MKYLNALKEEFLINIEATISYKTSFISETVFMCLLFIFLFKSGSGYSLGLFYNNQDVSKELVLVGFLMYNMSIMCINICSSSISAEATIGTLEQKYLSQTPIYILMLGQLLSSSIIQIVSLIIIGLVSKILFNISITITGHFILAFLINMLGMYGIGLVFGGIALKEKKIGRVVSIAQVILIFITDIFSMSDVTVNRIIPLTIGNDIARKSMTGNQVLISDYASLIIVSAAWLFIGILMFKYFEKKTKKEGLLSTY